jgi:hypothetical protein
MFKLIGLKRPKHNPRSYIVVREDGAYWANESGAIVEPVAEGTIHQVAESGSAFGEAMLLASLALSRLEDMEARLMAKIGGLTDAVGTAERGGESAGLRQASGRTALVGTSPPADLFPTSRSSPPEPAHPSGQS